MQSSNNSCDSPLGPFLDTSCKSLNRSVSVCSLMILFYAYLAYADSKSLPRTGTSPLQRILSCSWQSLQQIWLLKFFLVFQMQFRVWCVSQSSTFLGLLRSLLGSLFTLASDGIQNSQSGLRLLCRFAMPHISLRGFLLGLGGASFLDCVVGCTHVH